MTDWAAILKHYRDMLGAAPLLQPKVFFGPNMAKWLRVNGWWNDNYHIESGEPMGAARNLAYTLEAIENYDTNYTMRYPLVFQAMHEALMAGFKAGIRLDPKDPEWPVVYIELPTGQVSWHMPQHESKWDGHGTPEKYQRTQAYVKSVLG